MLRQNFERCLVSTLRAFVLATGWMSVGRSESSCVSLDSDLRRTRGIGRGRDFGFFREALAMIESHELDAMSATIQFTSSIAYARGSRGCGLGFGKSATVASSSALMN